MARLDHYDAMHAKHMKDIEQNDVKLKVEKQGQPLRKRDIFTWLKVSSV